MKSLYKKLKQVFVAGLLVVGTTTVSFAHFGTKGPYGGTVTCAIALDTIAVYLGTDDGGVFESTTNGLAAWRARPVGLKSGKISAVAHTGSYLFAATADSGIYILDGYVGSDMYWRNVSTGLTNLDVTSLVAIDSITLLAGTNGGGIFKTTNKGATWIAVNSTLTNLVVNAFALAGTRVIHTSNTGVFASDDEGATWFSLNDISTAGVVTHDVSYNGTTDELVIASATGLFKTSTAGSTMAPIYSSVLGALSPTIEIRDISNDGATWYIATDNGVYTTGTGIINWIIKNNGLTTLDVTAIVPFKQNVVVGSVEEGVFQTSAGSPFWTQSNNGFNNLETYSLATSGVAVVVAATEKGVYVSKNLASSYTLSNSGLADSLNVTDLTFFGTKLFAATANAGVFVSADTGASWTAFNSGLGSNLQMKQVVASATMIYTYDSNGDVYVSDGTAAWTSIQTGLPLAVEPTSITFYGNNILMGTTANGVFIRPETGGGWATANTGLTELHVTSVTALEGKLYAGTNGSGVFVSDENTINWAATAPLSIAHTVTMDLDATQVQAMGTYGGYVFASYKGGLVLTSDAGASWEEGGNQFNLPSYTNVNKIAFVTTRVFVTTEQNSLYSNSLAELAVSSTITASGDATCNGSCNGTATVFAIGGTAPYTYMWSNGSTTSSVSNLCAQTYTITVTDANLATSQRTVTIGAPSALVATMSSTASTTGADGSATATVSGGGGTYTYLWSNGGTTATITGIGAGIYTVTATDMNNCSVIDTVEVTGVVGIKEIGNVIGSFTFYPNPADDNIVINLKDIKAEVKTIAIYDVTGKLMQSIINTGLQKTIPVTVDYPAGIYYIQLNTSNGVTAKKLVVK